jgi:hypothetical protein
MINTIYGRLKEHLDEKEYELAIDVYETYEHTNWVEYKNGELIGFISYFTLPTDFDMIVTAAKDNKFSKSQWKELKKSIVSSNKDLQIKSDPTNNALHKGAYRLGGKFIEDIIHIPKQQEVII